MGCPACGGAASAPAGDYPGSASLFRGRALLRCPACALVYIAPMPSSTELDAYYSQEYWSGETAGINPHTRAYYLAQALARVAFVGGGASMKRVLDVGAGSGDLLHALRAAGFSGEYHFVEPDHEQQRALAAAGGVPQSDVGGSPGGYDLIVLSHVVEHVPAPQEILAAAIKKLSPAGRLFIELPNQDHLYKDVLDPHVLFFSEAALRSLLERHGQVVRLESCGKTIEELRAAPKPKPGLKALIPAPLKSVLKKLLGRDRPQPMEVLRKTHALDAYGEGRQWLRALVRAS